MSKAKNKEMRFISRIEQKKFNTWWVRLAEGTEYYTQKSFTDLKNGGKQKSLKAAKKFRDKEQKRIYVQYGLVLPRKRITRWGKGIHKSVDVRRSPPAKYWRATFWDTSKKKQLTKQFSVNKYGERLAKGLAMQWRELKMTGELNDIR